MTPRTKTIMWREKQPETARFVHSWWHRQWLGFTLGWPAHRVRTLTYDPKWYGDITDPVAIAVGIEGFLRRPPAPQIPDAIIYDG